MSQEFQSYVLDLLKQQDVIQDTSSLVHNNKQVDQQELLGVLKRLTSHEMVEYDSFEQEGYALTGEGQEILASGSHEVKVFELITAEGTDMTEVQKKLGDIAKIGLGKAFQKGWIAQKDSQTLIRKVEQVEDVTRLQLQRLSQAESVPEDSIKELLKRKLIEKKKFVKFSVRKGKCFGMDMRALVTDLNNEMLQDGSWRQAPIKPYNFNSLGQPTQGGHLHPLLKVREEFRQIFFEMGFTEMPTNQYVESSFWNFDTLFQPQMHPSRDAHDTFFLQAPKRTIELPSSYVEETCKMHQEGGFGSIGHKYEWKEEESRKNILRTHTTAVSSRMLYKLAQEVKSTGKFRPVKYFSIDKVFRNETVDATHLAEFHQIEGLIADHNLTLGDLIGMLNEFFRKLGMTKLRFKPAFNPYTEPSMEIFAYHEGLGKWIEVGNSGVFRPEMLEPMGFDSSVRVIAWGLSLERPTMIKYKISNIRDLVGHKVDLAMVQRNPVCRLDK